MFRAEQSNATQASHEWGGIGDSAPGIWTLDSFCNFAAKNTEFNAILITFRTFLKPCE